MKKWLPVWIVLFCVFLGSDEVSAEQRNTQKEEDKSERTQHETNQQITKEFIGRGNTETDRNRQKRSLRYSSLETTGLYANQGDSLAIEVSGQDGLEVVIGTPERDTPTKYSLNQGLNSITVENKGSIYIINPNEQGSAVVTISGANGVMPYFNLNTTKVKDFQKQMSTEVQATDVQLVSNKAIITVSYEQAKKQLGDPKKLMEYYDKFLLAQDRVSGIGNSNKPENAVDRHFQHFIEVSRKYMFATYEYMGFHGDEALSRLLKVNNGWGIWHESGHQRQQFPWKWGSVTESNVNIYSMAAQKEITGAITAMDKYYPQMHTYLESENRDFEKQNNDLKMVLFGQLANTFGENFYPILHQYYRENNLSYSTDIERIQNFVLNVSKITGYNMGPYFEKWGFAITDSISKQIGQLNSLPAEIWLNDNQVTKKLPMRLINNVSLANDVIKIALTEFETDVFQGQKVVLFKNDKYISELTNKKPYYSSIYQNVWQTQVVSNPTDVFRIEVRNSDGTFNVYKSSIVGEQLKDDILGYLNAEASLSELLSQARLDEIRSEIGKITDNDLNKSLLDLLEQLETKYLESLVTELSLDDKGNLLVAFSNAKFKEYNKIVVLGTNKYIAELIKGVPYYSSLSDNTLKVAQRENNDTFAIQFRLAHKTYTVSEVAKDTLVLKNDIEKLFTSNNQLQEDVTQVKLDELRTKTSLLSGPLKEKLMKRLDEAQQLFFETLVAELAFNNNKVAVSFSNDLYQNYKIVILENKEYMAELTNGTPYYGQLNNKVFTTTKNAKSGSLYEVEIRHASGNYLVKAKEHS